MNVFSKREDCAMTVKELIVFLLDKDRDERVVLRDNNGRSYELIDVWEAEIDEECILEMGKKLHD